MKLARNHSAVARACGLWVVCLFAWRVPSTAIAQAVTYADPIHQLFQNSCLNCHNPDKQKAGLDLSTYESAMSGSDSGKVIEPGNSSKSLLYRLITHAAEPSMPAKADKLPDSQIDLIRRWIEAGAPEKPGGAVARKTENTGAAVVVLQERPKGPPPMPHDLLLEPVVRSRRAGAIAGLAGSPWAPLVALTAQRQVLLYNTDTMDLAGVLPFPEGFPFVLKFSRNGQLLLAGGGLGAKLGKVVVWDVTTGTRVIEAGDEFDTVLAADISPDQSVIALGGPGKIVKIFSARDGALLCRMKKHTDWVTAMSFTPDGKTLITGDRAGGLVAWDSRGHELQSISAHKGAITAVTCFGSAVATASEDGSVKFWNLEDGTERKSWDAHPGGVTDAAFAPDGTLVTSGRDRMVKLWDASGKFLRQFDAFQDVALQAALAGGKVVGGDWTGAVRVWTRQGKLAGDLDANPPTLAERVAASSSRVARLTVLAATTAQARRDAESAFTNSANDLRAAGEAVRVKQVQADAAAAEAAVAQLKVKQFGTAPTQESSTPAGSSKSSSPEITSEPQPHTPEIPAPVTGDDPSAKVARANEDAERAAGIIAASAAQAANDLSRLKGALTQKASQMKNAEELLAKCRVEDTEASSNLENARVGLARWKAAQMNSALLNAREETRKRKAELDRVVWAASSSTLATADKARASRQLDAAKKNLEQSQSRTLLLEQQYATMTRRPEIGVTRMMAAHR